MRSTGTIFGFLFIAFIPSWVMGDEAFFESKIRPILVKHCYECHSGEKAKGGLTLDTRAGWEKGGNSGPALIAGKPEESLLIQAVRYDKDLAMPPKSKGGKLASQDIANLHQWVKMGAPDPRKLVKKIGGMNEAEARSWWSFQTLAPPADGLGIDRLLEKKRVSQGLKKSNPVDRRTLIRRATYDLTGLPPTPAEVDAFIADKAADAYPRLIDRLLASSSYGEKWGRLWLDVVRYADSAGENADMPLPHAWRYRNWVIDALNRDMPYDEFIRQQVAGDILAGQGNPEDAAGKIVATGFLAVARRFGHEIEKDMHLTYEDTLDTLGKTVLGLSLGCARCHDHKYDPITNRDYYGLYGILQSTRFPFTGCEPKPQPRDLVPISSQENKTKLAAWENEMQGHAAAVKGGETALVLQGKEFPQSAPTLIASGDLPPLGSQEFVAGSTPKGILKTQKGEMLQLTILPKANFGGDSTIIEWVISEEGGAGRVWNLTADYLADPFQNGEGMQHADRHGNQAVWHLFDVAGEPRLFTEYIKDAEKSQGLMVWRGAALWPAMMVNTREETLKFQTVTLPGRSVAVHPGPKGGVAIAWESPGDLVVKIRGKISKADPGGDGVAWRLERRPGIGKALAGQKKLLQAQATLVKNQEAAQGRKPAEDLAFATIEAKPGNARIQKKGEPKDLGDEVPRGLPAILGGAPVPPNEGSGRLHLARWLTAGPAKNLAARVMANRLWAGHFGTGIVPTPNDFGSRGTPPTDPELLDFLASRFMKEGASMKAMHRLIMISDAYQSAEFPRRRLTAEEMRDTLLFVSGTLDQTPAGPHPFPPESSWRFTQHNPFKAVYDNNRRSVYQMVQRTQRHPYLSLFDGADPNASTPVRTQSTVPTQALYFMNDPFVHNQAMAFTKRVLAAAQGDEERLDLATRCLYGRAATMEEKTLLKEFLASQPGSSPTKVKADQQTEAWASWMRILFSSNEMIYVD